MKYEIYILYNWEKVSLSSRRAWIEISIITTFDLLLVGRSPHGERGLKSVNLMQLMILACRSPHGERGLKLYHTLNKEYKVLVALLTESVD